MRRLLAVLLPCLLALAPLAGCGEEDVDPNALAEAADATRGQGTVHMTVDGVVRAAGLGDVPMRMEGDADFKRKRMRMTVDMRALAEAAGGGADASQFQMEQVILGTTVYMRMPVFEEALDAEWVKLDLQKIGEQAGFDFSEIMQMTSASPAEQLEFLRATSDLEEVGTEDVDGVPTTHYKGEVDLRRAADVMPTEDRERLRKTIDRLVEAMGESRYPVEIWIDDDLLVRREKFEMSLQKPQEMDMEMDIRFSDFGKPVHIETPTGDVRDITELATQQGGLFGPSG